MAGSVVAAARSQKKVFMVTNDVGQIALKHHQPGRVLVPNNPSGKDWVFITEANICMAWVDPIDVPRILELKANPCCGEHRKKLFTYANESDVRRWTNKGGQ